MEDHDSALDLTPENGQWTAFIHIHPTNLRAVGHHAQQKAAMSSCGRGTLEL
ncbi:hypothetical protein M404DRAFT_1005646 [Pisolithus tinctorius Marx 270]|uniref:Uncharacterized protein n=1 Tax=Pisolithus tinctorius Marx 270 TaxID=870435 RepID=A0A0C3JKL4_PISTI|nr:hypothetical protein M404DRAFT_1005646 [Pisolithus tinctorius Marx 270]